ncbi:class I SAM-dependent methyltransferase [Streptomyces pathocidini]|uniref:Class I SAM-dependent methyltransferase n=2 Tax=Streptomyces pathocidini TaxID=1650571 RepID=A0ABW7UZM2_9ACTN
MTQHLPGPGSSPQHPPIPSQVEKIYGSFDLSSVPAFTGGFINFGHWRGIPADRPLTEADRLRAEQQLYRLVLGEFERTKGLEAVEVGCGLGLGCALALREFGFAEVCGIDVHPAQLDRARIANADVLALHPERLRYVRGAAEAIPLPDRSADCLYSVEAAQHFPDLPGFAHEAARVLRPGGRLTLSTFFARGESGAEALPRLLPTYSDGLDLPHVIGHFTETLSGHGFADVRVRPIGEDIWAAYDRWLAQTPLKSLWPRRFLEAYVTGLLDYYLVTADAATDP